MHDLSKLKQENNDAEAQGEKNRKQIVELGRFFLATIDEFINTHGDIPGDVVVGAAEYLKELYQERMVGYMLNHSKFWGHLRDIVEKEGVKIHEPFENDGVDSNKFTGGPRKAPMIPQGGPQ